MDAELRRAERDDPSRLMVLRMRQGLCPKCGVRPPLSFHPNHVFLKKAVIDDGACCCGDCHMAVVEARRENREHARGAPCDDCPLRLKARGPEQD